MALAVTPPVPDQMPGQGPPNMPVLGGDTPGTGGPPNPNETRPDPESTDFDFGF